MRRKTLLLALAAVIAACLPALATQDARAAFPGKNGKVFFESSRSGRIHVYSMTPGGTATELMGINDSNNEEEPAVSPDGSRVAFVYGRDIWVMNSDGTGPRRLTSNSDFNDEPAWSPDGAKIAFVNGDSDIVVMNADGMGKTNLTNSPDEEYDPAWSPDGTKIAFTRFVNGWGDSVFVMDANGGTATELTPEQGLAQCPSKPGYSHKGSSSEPAWSPDGTRIAFQGTVICPHSLGTDIWVMNSDGSGKDDLTNDDGTGEGQPAFSPDGTKIAFARDDNAGGPPEIWAINTDGSGTPTDLTNDPARDESPDWQPIPQCTITGSGAITGTPGEDVLCGSPGDDTMNGAGGNDIILGGGGKDKLIGSSGNDTLNGGLGLDTVLFPGSTPIKASLDTGFATGVGSDVLLGVENLSGSGANDLLTGSAAGNTLVGGKGADKLYGLGGPDTLNSRDGVNGNDTLSGGPGTDACTTDATEKSITNCES